MYLAKCCGRIAFALLAIGLVGTCREGMASTVTFSVDVPPIVESPTVQTYTGTVIISDTNPSDQIGGFQLDLFISATSAGVTSGTPVAEPAVNFKGYAPDAGPSYIYHGNSSVIEGNLPGYLTDYESNELYPYDLPNTGNGTFMTQSYTLATFTYSVAAGFVGEAYFVWNVNSPASDGNAPFYNLGITDPTSYSPNLVGAALTLVPEPGSFTLMALAAASLSIVACRKRRGRERAN